MSPNLARLLSLHELNPKPFLACAGGDNRDRTDDPLLAKQVLSQLSYTPVVFRFGFLYSVLNEPQKLNND